MMTGWAWATSLIFSGSRGLLPDVGKQMVDGTNRLGRVNGVE